MTHDPVVRVEAGTWCRIVDVDGLGLRRALSFEREVTWTREAGTRVRLVNGAGREVDQAAAFCDARGFLGCLEPALESATGLATDHGVGAGPFAVEILLDVRDVPGIALPPERWDTDSTPRRYRQVPRDWIGHADVGAVAAWMALGDERYDDMSPVRSLGDRKPFIDGAVVWTTRGGAARDMRALREAVDAALEGFPPEFAAEVRERVAGYVDEAVAPVDGSAEGVAATA